MKNLYPGNKPYRGNLPDLSFLTDDLVNLYLTEGFVAIENVFTPEQVDGAKEELLRLITSADFQNVDMERGYENRVGSERTAYVRKVWAFVKHSSFLKEISEHPRLISVIERLVGSRMILFQDMAMLKPSHVGREKPWHQDQAYFRLDPPNGVICAWIALDHATVENGRMHVIPGSHLKGAVSHYHDRDCQIPDEDVEVESSLYVDLAPGCVLFFNSLLHHGTPANASLQSRWALQFHFASVDCRKISVEEHGDLFHDTLGYTGCYPTRPIASRPHGSDL